jgi:hypothetical protein
VLLIGYYFYYLPLRAVIRSIISRIVASEAYGAGEVNNKGDLLSYRGIRVSRCSSCLLLLLLLFCVVVGVIGLTYERAAELTDNQTTTRSSSR